MPIEGGNASEELGGYPMMAVATAVAPTYVEGRLYRLSQNLAGAMRLVVDAGTALIGKVDHSTTGISDGHKEVTTAGTAVVLAASTLAKWVTVQAYRANTGFVGVGASTVLASGTIGTGRGVSLAAGESITLPIDNLADVFVDATVNGEGVRFTYGV